MPDKNSKPSNSAGNQQRNQHFIVVDEVAVTMTSLSPPVAPESRFPYPPPAVAWYAVAVLLVAYTSSFIDRTIMALLVQPIQRDLGIGDTQLSLLHGFAFAIFYTTLGHREDVWENPLYQQHILGGIKWALGLEPGESTPLD